MALNVNRIGLTELYCPTEKGKIDLDVVFVHGLFGHPYNTWTYRQRWYGRKRRKQWRDKFLKRDPRNSDTNSVVEESDEGSESEEDLLVDLSEHSRREEDREGEVGEGNVKHAKEGPRFDKSNDVYWPRDLLPKRLPNARIFTWGYDADIGRLFSSASGASIFHLAGTLLEDIAGARESLREVIRPLVFVAHSLGGIVVKETLCTSRLARSHVNATFSATVGVCFLGTPHRGSSTATLGKVAFEAARVFFKSPNLQVLRSLEKQSEQLGKIGWAFSQLMEGSRIQLHSFREELPTKGVMIVDVDSSSLGYSSETTSDIYANHANMTRFASVTDVGFNRIANVLRRWAQEKFCASLLSEPESDEKDCIASLNIPGARERIHNVDHVYKDTYNWLFGHKTSFAQWLKEETGSNVYWIKGKPGSRKSTLMKFALCHEMTRRLLRGIKTEPWIIAGFFFHDRGSAIQKSIEGLLCEILYQLMMQNKKLIRFFYPVYLSEVKPENTAGHFCKKVWGSRIRDQQSRGAQPQPWTMSSLRNTFLAIARQRQVKINVCLFIDALDEHMGNHRELLTLLTDFTEAAHSDTVHIKLCLASRAETVFQDALQNYPGFAIHDHTSGDIETYVLGGLQHVLSRQGPLAGYGDLKGLIDDLIKKAAGVFIWVRLVVNELIEGLCDGSTISELRALLESIPAEIEDLYHRILTRINPRYRYEAFIMFQIALYSRSSCSLSEFIRRSHFLCNNKFETSRDELAFDTMSRRLTSRSGGLLECNPDLAGGTYRVNFLHQTAKEFVRQKSLARVLIQDPEAKLEHGHVLLFSYCCALLQHGNGAQASDFVYHARLAEHITQAPQVEAINHLVSNYSSNEPLKLWTWAKGAPPDSSTELVPDYEDVIAPTDPGERLQLWPLLQAILGRLPLLLKANFRNPGELCESRAAYLLHAAVRTALVRPSHDEDALDNPALEILEILLKGGLSADARVLDSTALTYTADKGFEPEASRIVALLLKYNADPCQMGFNRANSMDQPLISIAARNNLPKTVELLVKQGVDPLRSFDEHEPI